MEYLGYIFVFYIGFYYYRLAENHKKYKWLFAIVGIATYFTGSAIYPLYLWFFTSSEIPISESSKIAIQSFFIGLLCVFALFHILDFFWNRKEKTNQKEIDKIGK